MYSESPQHYLLQGRTVREVERSFRFSEICSMVAALATSLIGAGVKRGDDDRYGEIQGVLNLSHDGTLTAKSAKCRFIVSADWRSQPPAVFCVERWMKNDWDWHAGMAGRLCYVLDTEWADIVSGVVDREGTSAAVKYAVTLCLRNVRWLVYRHYIASVTGIVKWPKEWPQWSHGDIGRREYLKEPHRR